MELIKTDDVETFSKHGFGFLILLQYFPNFIFWWKNQQIIGNKKQIKI